MKLDARATEAVEKGAKHPAMCANTARARMRKEVAALNGRQTEQEKPAVRAVEVMMKRRGLLGTLLAALVAPAGAAARAPRDDAAAVQGIIDAAHRGGLPAYLPAGTYVLERTLIAPDGMRLCGIGDVELIAATKSPMFQLKGRAEFRDLYFVGWLGYFFA